MPTELLTKQQQIILEKFSQNEHLKNSFYFTGGTALSYKYLQHRYSDDLDFFSAKPFDNLEIFSIVQTWAKDLGVEFTSRTIGNIYNFHLKFSPEYSLMVEFVDYPYEPLEKFEKLESYDINVDSLKDIATNKFVVLGQRTDVKDFVDLYFLLKQFNVYELFELSNKKFKREYELLLFAADLLKIEAFDYLPRMIVPVELAEIKSFFLDLAKKLGSKGLAR